MSPSLVEDSYVQGCASHESRLARQRAVSAILPSFRAWLHRKTRVTYRLTQVLTGHRCFGEYPHRIGREASAQCHHFGHAQESAQHTLEECVLVQHIGPYLSPETVVAAMVRSGEAWNSVVAFCDRVMLAKQDAERARERDDPARRRRRAGRR
ncbi:uncharacterized protein [Epargyreus clarus]|uniref:uncharacterized protein n=1 Tax=Epargyreus clarus TaxID=520877 RepID=UPI003C2F3AA1